MFELHQLEQLLTIEKCGTITKAAEELHLSQPALSRSIQRLEEELGVSLFSRQKNKVTFNESGLLTLSYAKALLEDAQKMTDKIRLFECSKHTISIGSVAPAPLWEISPVLTRLYPDMTLQTQLSTEDALLQGLLEDVYQIIITKTPLKMEGILCDKYVEEHLFISLAPAHPLAGYPTLSLKDLNGQSILILSKIGFWYEAVKEKMPDSLFLVQQEMSALNELRRSSALPSFVTDLTQKGAPLQQENRVLIPLTDPEVNVTFYCSRKQSFPHKELFSLL